LEIVILKKFINKFKSNNGFAYPLIMAIILALIILTTGITEYFRVKMIVTGIRNAVENSVINVSTKNYDINYSPLREGYSGGFINSDGNWKEITDEIKDEDVCCELSKLLGLTKRGNKYIKHTGEDEYILSNLHVNIINSTFAPETNSQVFEAETFLHVDVPFSFGWNHIPPLKVNLKVHSRYMAKF
jgi:hypothetical protein